MFIHITASEIGNNKGSCAALVNYLEKENHLNRHAKQGSAQEYWFNGTGSEIERQQVRMKIDQNIAKLGRADSKYFLINISPSQKELKHLYENYGKQGAKVHLKAFALHMMDAYAQNFKRTGIHGHQDLLWFAKHENYRYYGHTDQQVKDGTRQKGERKAGRQDHIQIIVSRKDINNRIKLSPQNNSRGKNKTHSAKVGEFNRTAFKESGEAIFDQLFNFERTVQDSFHYVNTIKNGQPLQRCQMQLLKTVASVQPEYKAVITDLSKEVAKGLFTGIDDMLRSDGKSGTDLLSILMQPVQSTGHDPNPKISKRKKKKKGQSYDLGISR